MSDAEKDVCSRFVHNALSWQDVGYLISNYDVEFGPDVYVLSSGLNVDEHAVLGDYVAQADLYYAHNGDAAWTMTARINDEIQWVEEGVFEGMSYNYGGGGGSSDLFTVTLASYEPVAC